MHRPIMTHEFIQFEKEIKEKSKADFIALCADHGKNERDKLCIKAAKYAVGEMSLRGSFGYLTSSHNKMQQISWIEVINWLDDMLEKI